MNAPFCAGPIIPFVAHKGHRNFSDTGKRSLKMATFDLWSNICSEVLIIDEIDAKNEQKNFVLHREFLFYIVNSFF